MSTRTGFPGGLTLGDQTNQALLTSGKAASQLLRVAANVAQDETVTIGADVYRVADVVTDSLANLGDELAATGPSNNPWATIAMTAHGLKNGDVIAIGTEVMRVISALDADHIQVTRGAYGTTVATHANGSAILTEVAPGAGDIAVGMSGTLTPAVFTDRLVWAINNLGKERVKAEGPNDNTVIVATADKRGGSYVASLSALAVSETLGGAGNAWDDTTLAGGRAPSVLEYINIVPTAAQVTAGSIYVGPFPFVPVVEDVRVRVTASGAVVAWDGAATVSGNYVVLDNSGATDWATTSTITLIVRPTT